MAHYEFSMATGINAASAMWETDSQGFQYLVYPVFKRLEDKQLCQIVKMNSFMPSRQKTAR